MQGRVFERFYTADSAGGSGLGLAIARELAQRMDGRIAITSSKRFTAFTLDLPPDRLQPMPSRIPAPAEARRVRWKAIAAAGLALALLRRLRRLEPQLELQPAGLRRRRDPAEGRR